MNRQRARPISLPILVSVLLAASLALNVPVTSGFVERGEGGGSEGPPPGEPGAASQRYTFRSLIDFAGGQLTTDQTLEWTNRGSSAAGSIDLSVLPRALGIFTLDSINVDGQSTAPSWTTTTNMRVTFPRPVLPAGTVRIDISFTLAVGGPRSGLRDRIARRNGVINFGNWFPIWSREHDAYGIGDPQVSYSADSMRLELNATRALGVEAVTSSGSRLSASASSWVFEAANVRDFAFAVSPDFRLETGSVTCREGGNTYTTKVTAHTVTVSTSTVLRTAMRALRTFNSWYGCYRWPTFSLAEAAVVEAAEYPTMILLDPVWATNSYILYHEVAHQWWYAVVGNDQLDEPWVDEAWAQFSASFALGVPFSSCALRDIDLSITSWRGTATSGEWLGPQSYVETVYYRGAQFLNEIRLRMGSSAFFAAARRFIEANRYQLVTGEQLLAALEAGTSANLRPIIQEYTSFDGQGAVQVASAMLAGLPGHCPRR